MQNGLGINSRCQLGEMDQALDAIFNACESSKWRNLGHDSGDYLARRVALLYGGPGINLGPLDGERNLLLVFIDAEHLHLDLLADMQHFAGMIDAAPCQLADMDQSVCPSQVYKGAEVGKVA